MVVLGPNVNSLAVLRGNYFGESSHPLTVLDGIKKLAGSAVEVYYANEVPIAGATSQQLKFSSVTLEKIKPADLIILIGGLNATW